MSVRGRTVIDTDRIRAAMPGYSEAAACGDIQTRLEDVVITLCNEIDCLRAGEGEGQIDPPNAGG